MHFLWFSNCHPKLFPCLHLFWKPAKVWCSEWHSFQCSIPQKLCCHWCVVLCGEKWKQSVWLFFFPLTSDSASDIVCPAVLCWLKLSVCLWLQLGDEKNHWALLLSWKTLRSHHYCSTQMLWIGESSQMWQLWWSGPHLHDYTGRGATWENGNDEMMRSNKAIEATGALLTLEPDWQVARSLCWIHHIH